MKTFINYFSDLKFLAILLFFVSCNKEDALIKHLNSNDVIKTRSGMPGVINGMLDFSSYQDFENFINDLKVKEQDTLEIKSAFLNLGVDITQEFLPNLTFYPVALYTEQQLAGFTSARKVEENIINSTLNAGGNIATSIIDNAYLKSALNQDNSVHIGSRIFTFYPEGGITIVLNNDWAKYNSIKSLPYNSIQQSHNVFVTSNAYYNIDKIYTVDSLGNLLLEKPYVVDTTIFASPLFCDFSDQLVVTQLPDGNVRIDFPHSKPYDIYEWTFEDGTKSFAIPQFTKVFRDPNQLSSGHRVRKLPGTWCGFGIDRPRLVLD